MIEIRRSLALVLVCLFLAPGCTTTSEGLSYRGNVGPGNQQTGRWTYWYDRATDNKRAQGRYIFDRQTGPWTYWHENRQVRWIGSFEREQLAGHHRHWYESGTPRAEGFFQAGLEDGPWSFWSPLGELDQTGSYRGGQRTLGWSYFWPDGDLKARGYRFEGRDVGTWKFWDGSGDVFEVNHGMPSSVELIEESWSEGTLRREGFQRAGIATGTWVSYHPNGKPRMKGEFENGSESGQWIAWRTDGTPLASGTMARGKAQNDWKSWDEGETKPLPTARIERVAPPAADGWSDGSIAEGEKPGAVVSRWMAELRSLPVAQSGRGPASTGAPEPASELAQSVRTAPSIPVPVPPWTRDEVENLETLIALYSNGVLKKKRRGSDRYDLSKNPDLGGDKPRSNALLGMPFPQTILRTGDDGELNIRKQRSGKRTLVVVLRGYSGYVCVYCASQVRALRNYMGEFAELNTEIVVVYPGDRNRLEAFLEAYDLLVAELKEEREEIPFTMAYDPGFELRNSLQIQGKLAIPTTLLVDEEGTVRYAYIGKDDKIDRPSAEAVLEAIRALD